jgi:hypothetical protein
MRMAWRQLGMLIAFIEARHFRRCAMSDWELPKIITEEPETLEESYLRLHIDALPVEFQQLALAHHQDQFAAVPSYFEQQARQFVNEKE